MYCMWRETGSGHGNEVMLKGDITTWTDGTKLKCKSAELKTALLATYDFTKFELAGTLTMELMNIHSDWMSHFSLALHIQALRVRTLLHMYVLSYTTSSLKWLWILKHVWGYHEWQKEIYHLVKCSTAFFTIIHWLCTASDGKVEEDWGYLNMACWNMFRHWK